MKKIPFNIKYRDKIESGEYTVITFTGDPVKIYRWDYKDKDGTPILGSYVQGGYEYAAGWYEDGRFNAKPSDLDLMLVIDDTELLTPLAKQLSDYLKNDFEFFTTKKWDEAKWNEVMNIQAAELQRLAYLEKQKEQKELPLMGGDTDSYFDDLRMTTKPLTSREWFDEGMKYAQMLQKEQKPLETPSPSVIYTEQGEVLAEQKPAWSEEDEKRIKQLIYDTEHIRAEYEKRKDELGECFNDKLIKDCDEQITWLKSLRPDTFQNGNSRPKTSDNWKPSKEQLNALNFAITYFMHETNYKNPTELRDLYEDLLKLK